MYIQCDISLSSRHLEDSFRLKLSSLRLCEDIVRPDALVLVIGRSLEDLDNGCDGVDR